MSETSGGRPQLYCRPSHRVRAHEKRKAFEAEHQIDKLLRLLKPALISVAYWRAARVGSTRQEQAISKVRELIQLFAPEIIEDIGSHVLRRVSHDERVQSEAIIARALKNQRVKAEAIVTRALKNPNKLNGFLKKN